MRILLLNDYGVSRGGAEILSFALRNELRKREHDARLMTTSAGESDIGGETKDHQPVYRCFGTTSRYRTLIQIANILAFKALRQVLQEFQPEVVHVRKFLT